jgi:cholesterol oxidase
MPVSAAMFDVIIVGSGFGGAVPAYELGRAGLRVCLLERGPWRDTPGVRQAGIARRAPLPQGRHFLTHAAFRLHHPLLPAAGLQLHRHGLMELFSGDGVKVACTSGVGGGSHAYGGLHALPLDRNYWNGLADSLDGEVMAPHYAAVKKLLGSRPPPVLPDTISWQQGASEFVPVQGGQMPDWGYALETDFGSEGSFGSPDGNKVTLDTAILIPALRAGVDLRDCHEVVQVGRLLPGRFAVHAINHHDGSRVRLTARKVIMAAGAVNTLKLLLQSRAAGGLAGMPALGQGFGTNGDVMAFWPVNTPGANHPATGVYQQLFRHRDDLAGPLFMQAGISGLAAMPWPTPVRRLLQRQLFVAAMGVDAADGLVELNNDRIQLRYAASGSAVFTRIATHLARIGQLSGQRLFAPGTPTTVHPLGGARAGHQPETSVVNGMGEVHDLPGLFITDASALPAAPGSPPSLSIAAWARHVAMSVIRRP